MEHPGAVDVDRRGARARTALVSVLAVTTGATDALGFLGLGGAFSSVMTGNLVLFGLSIGTGNTSLLVLTASALGLYILGTAFGVRLAGTRRDGDPIWASRITLTLVVEFAVMLAFAVAWEVLGAKPDGAWQVVLLASLAFALGIQAAAVQALGVPGLSTTFMTGTLTRVITDFASGKGLRMSRQSLVILAAIIGGAIGGGALTAFVPRFAPALQLSTLGLTIIAALLVFRRRRA